MLCLESRKAQTTQAREENKQLSLWFAYIYTISFTHRVTHQQQVSRCSAGQISNAREGAAGRIWHPHGELKIVGGLPAK